MTNQYDAWEAGMVRAGKGGGKGAGILQIGANGYLSYVVRHNQQLCSACNASFVRSEEERCMRAHPGPFAKAAA